MIKVSNSDTIQAQLLCAKTEAIKTLVELAQDKTLDPQLRLTAAIELLQTFPTKKG